MLFVMNMLIMYQVNCLCTEIGGENLQIKHARTPIDTKQADPIK